jgi:GNAT superfamily N-acetyltransferase
MRIERFDPSGDSRAMQACHGIYLAGLAADDPDGPPMSSRLFGSWLRLGWTQDPREAWLACDETGVPWGWYVLGLPRRENRHLAEATPAVHPSRRRAGLGTSLLSHAAARGHELGRTTLWSSSREDSPGAAFAVALGAQKGITEVRRVLDVTMLAAERLTGLRRKAEAEASGYALVSWHGPEPEEHLAGVVAINAAVSADIPREEGHEPEGWDAERVRESSRQEASVGLRSHTVAARSLATGELAALSNVIVDPDNPSWGYQGLTAVTGPHRGHRLGLLVKLGLLDLLGVHEPQLSRVITDNAEENRHMIAINAELGYTVLDRWQSWEIGVQRVLAASQG